MLGAVRNKFADQFGLVGVVEDEQPAVIWLPAVQCVKDLCHGILDPPWGDVGQAKPGRERGESGPGEGDLVGGNPPDNLIPVGVTVGVLDGELGLSCSAKSR